MIITMSVVFTQRWLCLCHQIVQRLATFVLNVLLPVCCAGLMTQLNTMEPHYVRCIKPNASNSPALFENDSVLQQLR